MEQDSFTFKVQLLIQVNFKSKAKLVKSSPFNFCIVLIGSVSADDGISSSSNSREEDGSSSESDLDEELIVKGIFKNEHYIPLTLLQKSLLIVGSGLSSFFDPTRAGKR